MRTIAIISQKGGAGKTTAAVNLAVEAERQGIASAIVDLDPQSSSCGWRDSRAGDTPAVVSAQASRLTQVLDTARKSGVGLAIIDTAPHSESTSLAAARVADLILIPCRPAILDLRAIGQTIELSRLAKKPAVVILNSVPARGTLAIEAEAAIEEYGVDIAPTHLGQRAAFVHSLTNGLTAQEIDPDGKAANEIKRLFRWIMQRMEAYHDRQKTEPVRSAS